MKLTSRPLLLYVICYLGYLPASGQANIELSNLNSITAANLSLTPFNTEFVSLGSASKQWKYAYITGSVYFDAYPTIKILSGAQSIFIGLEAGKSASNIYFNTGLGDHSLKNNSGQYNTGTGYQTLMRNTTGSFNVAAGYMSLSNNLTGNSNSALGFHSLYSNKVGSNNIAVGYRTLYYLGITAPASPGLPQGKNNTAIGSQAMYSNRGGYNNTVIGTMALYLGVSAVNNTAAGFQAMYSNSTGIENTAIGFKALYSQTTVINNVAVGDSALYANRTGANNTAIGSGALAGGTQQANTAIGYNALKNQTTGVSNVSIGQLSGTGYTTGSSNTFIGTESGASVSTIFETTAIGYKTLATASNQVRIGNSDITDIGGTKAFAKISDARFMLIEEDEVAGMNFIEKLRPVSYTTVLKKSNQAIGNVLSSEMNSGARKISTPATNDTLISTGFIPAELSQLIKETSPVIKVIDDPGDGSDEYGIRYAEFVVPLVKSVQEMSGILNSKKNELSDVRKELDELRHMLNELALIKAENSPIVIYNSPNPLTVYTTIAYRLPVAYNKAFVVLYDKLGRKLQEVNISGTTNGNIRVDMSRYASGMYHYNLIIDGKIMKTEKMLKAQ
ncbi:T9SS type A sorting domain-containing protein [Pollutibacter soli]|uniref:T9SS type A sorting domain-containing protein n=1 Tax=Pollutibacter soli TaxID=3034157 RepID=UPI0030139C51